MLELLSLSQVPLAPSQYRPRLLQLLLHRRLLSYQLPHAVLLALSAPPGLGGLSLPLPQGQLHLLGSLLRLDSLALDLDQRPVLISEFPLHARALGVEDLEQRAVLGVHEFQAGLVVMTLTLEVELKLAHLSLVVLEESRETLKVLSLLV